MEVKAMGCTIKAVENINAGDTSQTIPIFVLSPGAHIVAIGGRVKTAFAGVTTPKVSLGIGDDTQKIMRNHYIGQTGDLKPGWAPNARGMCESLINWDSTESNIQIKATFSSASGNLSSLTTGEIEFYLVYVD